MTIALNNISQVHYSQYNSFKEGTVKVKRVKRSKSTQQSNMVKVVWWSGAALDHHESCPLPETPEGACPAIGYAAGQ